MFKLGAAGQSVFNARYAGRDKEGNINETFDQAVRRVAHAAALQDKNYEKPFVNMLGNLLFIPSTPIWANMGKSDRPWQPGACFVLDVHDSLNDMYQKLKDTAMIFKSGGGIGYNFSRVRPKGSLVKSTKGKASGVVELIKLYDKSSDMVMQGGVRRGASMGILNIDHPEIIDFIQCKLNGEITNFNLSVGVTDKFMKALVENEPWKLQFKTGPHTIIQARELWQLIAECAHKCGDPGLIFVDRLQQHNSVPGKPINATNPCGEQPLAPGESCLLGSINLAMMVKDGVVDNELLKETTALAVRFLDNLIDVAKYPLPQIERATKATRRIGLGFTGLHDALIMQGLAYDSKEGRSMAADITAAIFEQATATSSLLAEEKGCFPEWKNSIFYARKLKRRNASVMTIAPTGSVTAMAGCEGYGVEPIFAVAYSKATNVAGDFEVFSPLFLDACDRAGVAEHTLKEVARQGSCQKVNGIPWHIKALFKGAQDIGFKDHLLMQAAVQRNIDNAVSKTINMPKDATVQSVLVAYTMAYNEGLRGVTVFRDGCKQGVVTVGEAAEVLGRGDIMPRPRASTGCTYRLDTGCGKLYLTVNTGADGKINETFITTGSDGGCLVYTEATSRLISLAIRGGIDLRKIIEQLKSTHSCPSYMMKKGSVSPGKSCASAIANKLVEILDSIEAHKEPQSVEELQVKSNLLCESCGSELHKAEGCYVCPGCGYSKC